MDWYLSSTEIDILQEIIDNSKSIGQLAESIGLSLSTISLAVKHLFELGFISKERKGKMEIVSISEDELGRTFRTFVMQNSNQNPEVLFKGHGLIILSVCIGNGSTLKEIQERTFFSRSSISRYLKKWSSTGILWKEGHGGKIRISKNYPDLELFLSSFSKFRMKKIVQIKTQSPSIIFNKGNTLFFSTEDEIQTGGGFTTAGYTHLARSGFDVVTDRNYYQFSPGNDHISILEAILQAIRSDVMNPRPRKLLKEHLAEENVDFDELMDIGRKYAIESIIEKVVKKYGRKEAIQEG
jgi:DNA-binding transcriptional regulator GbsR (MarR family)